MAQYVFHSAERVQQSFLSSAERHFLYWLANHMPAWVKPDHLTSLGLTAMVLGGVSYALSSWSNIMLLVACVCIVVNWFGDSLDGTLARVRRQERPRYGFYIDHMLDVIGIFFLLSGLAASAYGTFMPAAAVLVAFLMLCINAYLYAHSTGVFKLSVLKLGPTEMRILMIAFNCYAFSYPVIWAFGNRALFFDVASIIAAILMGVILIFSVIQNIVELYRLERV